MKSTLLLCSAFLLAAVCGGGGLVVADNAKSDYQIVVPDGTGDKALDGFVELGGKVIQTAIRKASGAEVPLVRESARIPGKPAIVVGDTRSLKEAKLSGTFEPWEHAITVRGKDIFLYGGDEKNPLKKTKYPNYFIHYTLGSLKAATVFAEKFLNTRFVGRVHNSYGENHGARTLEKKRITVPENFSLRQKARFKHCDVDKGGLLYAVANNYFFDCGAQYNVHYHVYAIPQDKYYPTHPEYFALIDGKRLYHKGDGIHEARPQYCLSNPEVQELIYRNALDRADAGFKVVEFGQSDGFIGCQCDKCRAMYGTSDWGEKLWCLHRDLAARLHKERPGVKTAIACYGPTHQLPKGFNKFPVDGMIVDVAPVTPELLDGWKKFNLGGMAAWTYYSGDYHPCGYSPGDSFADQKKEAAKLRKTPVTSLYNCGLLTAPAISGPWIYAWGRFLGDEKADPRQILRDYCRFGFGEKAAPYFEKFFALIDSRLELLPLPKNDDFNDFSKKNKLSAIAYWQTRYPAPVMAELTGLFAEGVKRCDPENPMLAPLKIEFEYLRLSAAVCNTLKAWNEAPTSELKCRLADAVEARNKFIDSLPEKNGRIEGGIFQWSNKRNLRAGGGMRGVFGGVFDLDPALLRQERRNTVAVKVKDFADPAWKEAPEWELHPFKSDSPKIPAAFRVGYSDRALLFKFSAPHPEVPDKAPVARDGNLWRNAVGEILIAAGNDMRHFVFNPQPGSAYDAVISGGKSDVKWNTPWSHRDRIENGVWHSEVTIPFAGIGRTPKPGERWRIQIGHSRPGGKTHYAWNVPERGGFSELSGFGEVRFGTRPDAGKARPVDINGNFARVNASGRPELWIFRPASSGKTVEENGKKTLRLTFSGTGYAMLHCDRRIALAEDETATLTVTVRGKGRAMAGLGWYDAAGRWRVNDHSKAAFELTPQAQTRKFEFKAGMNRMKGGEYFCPSIFLQTPGGELNVESAALEIR